MIEVDGLIKNYAGFRAVDGLSFSVAEGEIFGFIGPNGAGKTTTIRILATLLRPSAGTARVGGYDVNEDPEKVREVMGYMPDLWGVYPDITVREYLEFFAAAYAIPRRERRRVVGDVMQLTDLDGLATKLVAALSKGMKQRLCLAKTLIHDPRLLILDEPANGLDPRARIVLRELLRELAAMGKTIFISSHILTELSDLVSSVGIVERGRMLMCGDVRSILARIAKGETPAADEERSGDLRRYVLRTTAATRPAAEELLLSRVGMKASGPGPALREVSARDVQEVLFAYAGGEEDVAALVRLLVTQGVDVLGLSAQEADLEEVFMAITRGEVQ